VTPLSGKQLSKAVERLGWELLRVHGSHHVYGKPGSIIRLSIPIHGNRPLRVGLFGHPMKSAGLTEADLG